MLASPATCFNASAYGALLIVDSEDEFYKQVGAAAGSLPADGGLHTEGQFCMRVGERQASLSWHFRALLDAPGTGATLVTSRPSLRLSAGDRQAGG